MVNKVFTRVHNKLAQHNKAPDMMIDKVQLFKDQCDAATHNGGNLIGVMVSTPVEEVLVRAQIRAQKIGRTEQTENLLKSHKNSPLPFFDLIGKLGGQNVGYLILDNGNDSGSQPQIVAKVSCKDRKIEIQNKDLMLDFLDKISIDVEQTIKSRETTYHTEPDSYIKFTASMYNKNYSVSSAKQQTTKKTNIPLSRIINPAVRSKIDDRRTITI